MISSPTVPFDLKFVKINFGQESPRQTKPKKVSSWTFPRGIPEQEFNVNRACFPKEKHQSSQKWAKFMNFLFWPFLWSGLPGRLMMWSQLPEATLTSIIFWMRLEIILQQTVFYYHWGEKITYLTFTPDELL